MEEVSLQVQRSSSVLEARFNKTEFARRTSDDFVGGPAKGPTLRSETGDTGAKPEHRSNSGLVSNNPEILPEYYAV